jgi:hypothetical protein
MRPAACRWVSRFVVMFFLVTEFVQSPAAAGTIAIQDRFAMTQSTFFDATIISLYEFITNSGQVWDSKSHFNYTNAGFVIEIDTSGTTTGSYFGEYAGEFNGLPVFGSLGGVMTEVGDDYIFTNVPAGIGALEDNTITIDGNEYNFEMTLTQNQKKNKTDLTASGTNKDGQKVTLTGTGLTSKTDGDKTAYEGKVTVKMPDGKETKYDLEFTIDNKTHNFTSKIGQWFPFKGVCGVDNHGHWEKTAGPLSDSPDQGSYSISQSAAICPEPSSIQLVVTGVIAAILYVKFSRGPVTRRLNSPLHRLLVNGCK